MGRLSILRSFAQFQNVDQEKQNIEANQPQSPDTKANTDVVQELHKLAIKGQIQYVEHIVHTGVKSKNELPHISVAAVEQMDGKNGRPLGIVVDDVVLDCTDFRKRHPGGASIIESFAGKDCSWQWWTFHGQSIMEQYGFALRIATTSNVPNPHQQPIKRAIELKVTGDQW